MKVFQVLAVLGTGPAAVSARFLTTAKAKAGAACDKAQKEQEDAAYDKKQMEECEAQLKRIKGFFEGTTKKCLEFNNVKTEWNWSVMIKDQSEVKYDGRESRRPKGSGNFLTIRMRFKNEDRDLYYTFNDDSSVWAGNPDPRGQSGLTMFFKRTRYWPDLHRAIACVCSDLDTAIEKLKEDEEKRRAEEEREKAREERLRKADDPFCAEELKGSRLSFVEGQPVYRKDLAGEWEKGFVTQVNPLKVDGSFYDWVVPMEEVSPLVDAYHLVTALQKFRERAQNKIADLDKEKSEAQASFVDLQARGKRAAANDKNEIARLKQKLGEVQSELTEANLALGADYEKTKKDLDDAKKEIADLQAKLKDAQKNAKLAVNSAQETAQESLQAKEVEFKASQKTKEDEFRASQKASQRFNRVVVVLMCLVILALITAVATGWGNMVREWVAEKLA